MRTLQTLAFAAAVASRPGQDIADQMFRSRANSSCPSPTGSFSQSCFGCHVSSACELSCTCDNGDGQLWFATANLTQCSELANFDGNLRCMDPAQTTTTTTTTTTTMTTTTVTTICSPGNSCQFDPCSCMMEWGELWTPQQCRAQGNIGCGGSPCIWVHEDTHFGGFCQSAPANLTCHPGNEMDPCYRQCTDCLWQYDCTGLGNIGCDGSQCTLSPVGESCQSLNTTLPTTTSAPVVI